jgi:hypothetical protein
MPILGVIASSTRQGLAPSDTGVMFPIATTALTSATGSVTFSSIPLTYTHLQIRLLVRTTRTADGGASTYMQFNGDTGSNYSRHSIYGYASGSTTYVDNGANSTYMWVNITGTDFNAAGYFSSGVIDIFNYAKTNQYKTVRSIGGNATNNTQGQFAYHENAWRNTNAVTSITLFPNANNFTANSQFALYGIKGS